MKAMIKGVLLCALMSVVACVETTPPEFQFEAYVETQEQAVTTEQAPVLMLKDFGLSFPVKMEVEVSLTQYERQYELPGMDFENDNELDQVVISSLEAKVLKPGCTLESTTCDQGRCKMVLSAATEDTCVIELVAQSGQGEQTFCYGWHPMDRQSGGDMTGLGAPLQTELLNLCAHVW